MGGKGLEIKAVLSDPDSADMRLILCLLFIFSQAECNLRKTRNACMCACYGETESEPALPLYQVTWFVHSFLVPLGLCAF